MISSTEKEAGAPCVSLERVSVVEEGLGIVIGGSIFGRRCAFARESGRGGRFLGWSRRMVGSKALKFVCLGVWRERGEV